MAANCGICSSALSGQVVKTTCNHLAHASCFWDKTKLQRITKHTSKLFCFQKDCENYHNAKGKGKPTPFLEEKGNLTIEELKGKVTTINMPNVSALKKNFASIGVQTENLPDQQNPAAPNPPQVPNKPAPKTGGYGYLWKTPLTIAIDITLVTSIAFVALVIFQSFSGVIGSIVFGIFAVKMAVNPLLSKVLSVV